MSNFVHNRLHDIFVSTQRRQMPRKLNYFGSIAAPAINPLEVIPSKRVLRYELSNQSLSQYLSIEQVQRISPFVAPHHDYERDQHTMDATKHNPHIGAERANIRVLPHPDSSSHTEGCKANPDNKLHS